MIMVEMVVGSLGSHVIRVIIEIKQLNLLIYISVTFIQNHTGQAN